MIFCKLAAATHMHIMHLVMLLCHVNVSVWHTFFHGCSWQPKGAYIRRSFIHIVSHACGLECDSSKSCSSLVKSALSAPMVSDFRAYGRWRSMASSLPALRMHSSVSGYTGDASGDKISSSLSSKAPLRLRVRIANSDERIFDTDDASRLDMQSLWDALSAHRMFAKTMQKLDSFTCRIWVLERGKDGYQWPGDGVLLTGRTVIGEVAADRDEITFDERFATIHIIPGPDPEDFKGYTLVERPGPLPASSKRCCVNREVPAFLIAWWNLHFASTAAGLWPFEPVRYPFAVQPPGTGKTLLGMHLINILNRPRQDRRIEEPLLKAMRIRMPILQDSMIEDVLEGPSTEGVVVRALRRLFPANTAAQTRITNMMKARTFTVTFTAAVPVDILEAHIIDKVLRYALNALQIDPTSDGQLAEQLARVTAQNLGGTLCHLAAGPVLLVLDDIYSVLPQGNPPNRAALHECIGTVVKFALNVDFFMYCTSASTATALGDLKSCKRRAEPVLLQNLSADSVKEMITKSSCLPFPVRRTALLDRIAVEIVDLTGGVAEMAECCVTALSNLPPFEGTASDDEIFHDSQRAAEVNLQSQHSPRVQFSDQIFEHEGHTYDASSSAETLFRLVVACASTNIAIPDGAEISVTSSTGENLACLFKDLLVQWELHYEPALDVPGCFRVTPGRFIVQHLLSLKTLASRPVSWGILPHICQGRRGNLKVAPFPLMMAQSLSNLSGFHSGDRMTQALPFLEPYLEDKTDATLQPLKAVMLPQLNDGGKALSVEDMAELMKNRDVWHGPPVIAKEHRDWLILEWLDTHCIGLPAQSSSSQDVFLKLPHLVVGFAMKAFHGTQATQRHVEEEWGVAPSQLACANADTHYIMLFCSLRLDGDLAAQADVEPAHKSVSCSDSSRTTLILNPTGNTQAFDELLEPGATVQLKKGSIGTELIGLSVALTPKTPVVRRRRLSSCRRRLFSPTGVA